MSGPIVVRPDLKLDLVLERVVDVPRELVWRAWTEPAQLVKWFTPAPWKTVDCKIDLRPGGLFHTVMESPEGERFPNVGCYLEVFENERLTWTGELEPGYRPKRPGDGPEKDCAGLGMTAFICLAPHGTGTRYTAIALHRSEAERKAHEDMGFHDGWGKCLDQLVAQIKSQQGSSGQCKPSAR